MYIHYNIQKYTMLIEWDEEKNEKLKIERGFSFEQVRDKIINDDIIAIIPNDNYENQEKYILLIYDYPVVCPFVKTDKWVFLKTIFPDRRLKKFIKDI